MDILLETMTNKISNSNKSHIHIHIGDKGKKRRLNRRKTASRGHGGTYVTTSHNMSVPLFNRPQTLDTSLGDERERERVRIQRGIFESQTPSNNASSTFANGAPQNGQPIQPKAEPPAQPKAEPPAHPPAPVPAPAPAIRASASQHVLKHKKPHSAPTVAPAPAPESKLQPASEQKADLTNNRAEEEARRAKRAQAHREMELRAIEAERQQYREEQSRAQAQYNTGVGAIIHSNPVPQPVAMDVVAEADLPVDDIPPPTPPRHASSRPGPFTSRIGPFTSQNPSSGSASGVVHSDPVPSNQPQPAPAPVHHPLPDIPVIRYDPNGPYSSISRRRSHRHRVRDGPFSSFPEGKYYKRHDGETLQEARDFKKSRNRR